MLKRLFSILAAAVFLLSAASCGILPGGAKKDAEESSMDLPGVYEDGSGMTWILARDGTLRITDRERKCVLGTWEESEDHNDRLSICACPAARSGLLLCRSWKGDPKPPVCGRIPRKSFPVIMSAASGNMASLRMEGQRSLIRSCSRKARGFPSYTGIPSRETH